MIDTQKNSFSFTLFSKDDLLKAIKSLPSNKATPFGNIPIKVLKHSIHIYSDEYLVNTKLPNTLTRQMLKTDSNCC